MYYTTTLREGPPFGQAIGHGSWYSKYIYTNLDVPVYKTRAMTAGQGNIIFPPFKTPI